MLEIQEGVSGMRTKIETNLSKSILTASEKKMLYNEKPNELLYYQSTHKSY